MIQTSELKKIQEQLDILIKKSEKEYNKICEIIEKIIKRYLPKEEDEIKINVTAIFTNDISFEIYLLQKDDTITGKYCISCQYSNNDLINEEAFDKNATLKFNIPSTGNFDKNNTNQIKLINLLDKMLYYASAIEFDLLAIDLDDLLKIRKKAQNLNNKWKKKIKSFLDEIGY